MKKNSQINSSKAKEYTPGNIKEPVYIKFIDTVFLTMKTSFSTL